jgi:glycosyltransferase involved in cell wall biosynthesis
MKKKILFLVSDFPLPLDRGGNLRTWSFVESLHQDFDLTLVYIDHGDVQPVYLEKAKGYFKEIYGVKPQRGEVTISFSRRLLNLFQCIPWEIVVQNNTELEDLLQKLIGSNSYDFVFVRYIYKAHYLFNLLKKISFKLIVDLDDIEPIKKERLLAMQMFSGLYDRSRTFLNNFIFSQYHKRNLPKAFRCLVCSSEDEGYLLKNKWAKRVSVVPNSIDFSRYVNLCEPRGTKNILFCGTLNYQPNTDAVIWFVELVFSLILARDPDVRFLIVGRKPEREILNLADGKNIFVYSDVPDVNLFYEQAQVVIAPIRIAGGTRIKILEAAACKRPVVATTIGAEGLDLEPSKDILIADSPRSFSDACLSLIRDPDLAVRLAKDAYAHVKELYDIRSVVQKIRSVFDNVS